MKSCLSAVSLLGGQLNRLQCTGTRTHSMYGPISCCSLIHVSSIKPLTFILMNDSLTLMITILLADRKCISGATRTGSAAGNAQKAARSLAISVYYNLIAAYVTKLYTTMALVSAIKLESNIYNWKLASVYRQPTRATKKLNNNTAKLGKKQQQK